MPQGFSEDAQIFCGTLDCESLQGFLRFAV
jgi:hypothetical protein